MKRRANNLSQVKARCRKARQTANLDLSQCSLDQPAVMEIVQCLQDDNIEHLNLSQCRWSCLDDNMIVECTNLLQDCLHQMASRLRMVDLSHSWLGNQTTAVVLQSLHAAVTDRDTEFALEKLRVRGMDFADEACLQAVAALLDGSFPRLQTIDFASSRGLENEQVVLLAEKISNDEEKITLREVNFSACFHDQPAAVMIEALCQQRHLKTLVLTRNFIGSASRTALIQLLETCQSLKQLKFDFVGTLLSAGNSKRFAQSLAASTVEELEVSLLISEPRSMRQVLSALPTSESLRLLTIDGVALPMLAAVLPRFTRLRTLVLKGDFAWTPMVQEAFYHNASLQECITTCRCQSKEKFDLDALMERNRAITQWHGATPTQRAVYELLWPLVLSRQPMHSALAASCCLDLLRRGVVEA